MQRIVALALVACLWAGIVVQTSAAEDPAAKPKPAAKPAAVHPRQGGKTDLIVGEPVRYKNLAIFPVASSAPKNDDRYLTLDEGLKSGEVQVFEIGSQPQAAEPAPPQTGRSPAQQPVQRPANDDPFGGAPSQGAGDQGAEVNRLALLNKSSKPLYLMPGEIIYGGQQNRTIAVEAIIPPGKKPVSIDVYCVEHGRWNANGATEVSRAIVQLQSSTAAAQTATVQDAQSREKIANEAAHGKFVAHAGSLSKAGRAAVQEGKGQGEVWKKVAEVNSATANQSESGDFVGNYTDADLVKKFQPYIDAMQSPIADGKQVVGAIVAINGKVEAVDVFQSTPLFKKLWPKLLKGDALDAYSAAGQPDAKKQATVSDAREFLKSAMQASVAKQTDSPGGLVVTKRDSERVMSFSASKASMGGMGGAFGGGGFDDPDAVHSSGYKK